MVQTVKTLPAMQETGFNPWVGKIPWRRVDLLPQHSLSIPRRRRRRACICWVITVCQQHHVKHLTCINYLN